MRRAIASDFAAIDAGRARVVVTLDDRLGDDPGPWVGDRIGKDEAEARLVQLARESDFTVLIAPETTGILAILTRKLEDAGARLLGSSSVAVAMAGDKLALARHLAARGIETPPSREVRPSEGLPRDMPYPAVLKPVDGAGTIDTYLVQDPDDLPEAARGISRAILQPYVAGVAMSASYLVDSEGRAWPIAIGIQDVVVRGGRFEYRGGRIPSDGSQGDDLMRAVESVRGMQGFVGVDFVRDPRTGRDTVLEINPRPTTSIVGIVRILPPGRLASAWIAAIGTVPDPSILSGLADEIGAGPSIRFDTTGALTVDGVIR